MPKKTAKPKKASKRNVRQKTETTVQKQHKPWEFKPGQSGNPAGRPPGTRNALCKRYIEDLRKVWDEEGIKAVRAAAKDNPVQFARLVGALVPAEYDLGDKTRAGFASFLDAIKGGTFKPRAFDPQEDDGI